MLKHDRLFISKLWWSLYSHVMYIVHRQYKVSKVFVDIDAFSPLLKGLSHEIDMAFEDMPAVLGLK